jgi:hypothetical protein
MGAATKMTERIHNQLRHAPSTFTTIQAAARALA